MRRGTRLALAALLALGALASAALAQGDAERLKTAKSLFFDKKYAEARELWLQARQGGGPDADAALFWVARCSENLGERERAFSEYAEYLATRPKDGALVEEARTSRVMLATRLYEDGKRQYLSVLTEALRDSSKTVRYFAAFQLAGLGPLVGRPAVPVLKQILAEEKDDDLVERAKLKLIKIDPQALAPAAPARPAPAPRAGPITPGSAKASPAPAPRPATWIRVRIYERGRSEPKVLVNFPMALADLVFKSLPDDARKELRLKGYDADNFWERLKALGPTDILEIVGEDGERVKIWIE